jgi:murein L,D-transpeptidase YcbB/YkuD
MGSNSRCLLVLTLPLFTCISLQPAQTKERSSTACWPECERISRALGEYRLLASKDDEELLPVTEQAVEPGDSYEGVPRLIRFLSLIGDLSEDTVPSDSRIYEGELVEAVKRFQFRHGLKPDGLIGAATFEQLNTPLRLRVRQLERALQRWRSLVYDPQRRAIVLNVPEFRLRAYGAGSGSKRDPELEMKVIVGQAPEHKSPMLVSHVDTVIFRPYWNVPFQIQRDELLSDIRQNGTWIEANNFELVTPQGEVMKKRMASADVLSALSTGKLQLRQRPGSKNTLGLVKFLFPNDYGIYMHDTSARWLFAGERRDLSHGCIRVEKPVELAEWLLAGQSGWPPRRIHEAVQGTETVSVRVQQPTRVIIMYSTAAVMKNGEVHFFPDIYGNDGDMTTDVAVQLK